MSHQISLTKNVPFPNEYIVALKQELSEWAYDEERAPEYRGQWRKKAFGAVAASPLDLEIGTGNGFHFAHQANKAPERNLVGIELKYKPLVQAIRRVLRNQEESSVEKVNARMVRFHAKDLNDLFVEGEIDNVYIHFPDPWLGKKSRKKNRILQSSFLDQLIQLQSQGSFVEIKTDSREYFDQMVEVCEGSQYQVVEKSYDLHNSEYASQNFVTTFEQIFLREKLPIHHLRLIKA